ncbi:bifunctional glutathionylspermidine amidase/glutathionylspermidine synthetase [Thraustotheca clavata]|uniref:Bifunctional glutathionylspermidine amidase/glutathionylspermidine synthetase n=1 Tax=Thraustotheca clavata TaxID=74557 RepID=A0A1W0A207_9STRA|nr:bifunctional glutathionylspermidine amidase/glutathionylspermidine synthetase [Thraustotheca clavata]
MMTSCECPRVSNQTLKPKALLAKRPSKTIVCLADTALKLSDVEPALTTMKSTIDCNCSNAFTNDIQVHQVVVDTQKDEWLDASLPFIPVYQQLVGASLAPSSLATYYTLTESGHKGLKTATYELHDMFFKATEYVLENEDTLGPYFHIPSSLWPKIRASWAKSKHDVVSGRFDFALTDNGIKVYEYNADSASCLLECGYVQDAWATGANVDTIGRSSSSTLFSQLVATWQAKQINGPLHFMCDNDLEERYHAMYMKSAAEAAGIECRLIIGLDTITMSDDRNTFYDEEQREIRNVWKTWCWRTVMNQVEAREAFASKTPSFQLMDLLLHEDVRVFEPLWTLLAGSKAILPILSQLYPDCPYLLKSSFDEADVAQFKGGYVAKPVMGRTGSNIALYSADRQLLNETGGRWIDDTIVYQELAMLPKYNDIYVQVNTWAINGTFGGTVLRQDASSIIGLNSEIPSLRIVPDSCDVVA